MMIDRHIEELIEPHLSYCLAVKDAFKQAGLVVEDLDNYTVLNKIRQYLFPEYTSVNWKPLLPGDLCLNGCQLQKQKKETSQIYFILL